MNIYVCVCVCVCNFIHVDITELHEPEASVTSSETVPP